MKSWVLAAGLLVAVAAPPALAADMDDGTTPYPKGGVYDDRRYPPKTPPPEYYDEDEDDDGADTSNKYSHTPPPPPNKYSGVTPPPGKYLPPLDKRYSGVTPPPYTGQCVRSEEVRGRLTGMGWRDFHEGKAVNENVVTLRARRPNGRLFELTLHRCSGQIVEARPLEPRPYGYGYAEKGPSGPNAGPRTWGPYSYNDRPPWLERPYAYRWQRRWFREDD
jgi:hypothetical protein